MCSMECVWAKLRSRWLFVCHKEVIKWVSQFKEICGFSQKSHSIRPQRGLTSPTYRVIGLYDLKMRPFSVYFGQFILEESFSSFSCRVSHKRFTLECWPVAFLWLGKSPWYERVVIQNRPLFAGSVGKPACYRGSTYKSGNNRRTSGNYETILWLFTLCEEILTTPRPPAEI